MTPLTRPVGTTSECVPIVDAVVVLSVRVVQVPAVVVGAAVSLAILA